MDYRIINFAASLPHNYKIKNMFNNYNNKYLPKEYLKQIIPKRLVEKEKRGFGWNFDMNKLIHEKIFSKNDFDNFEYFNLNKNFFIKIADEFGKQIKKKMHPDANISRLFYNSIMLSKWINKL